MSDVSHVKYIIESLLFVSEVPVPISQIKKTLENLTSNQIRKALTELKLEYEIRRGGFYLSEVAGGYQLRTRPEYKDWIKKFIRSRPVRLSRASLETLAIIAYKQPITRSEIEHIRGVDSSGIVRTLVDYKLIRIIGRKEVPGRPMLFSTSKKFLEVFELKDLTDLPSPDKFTVTDQIEIEEEVQENKDFEQESNQVSASDKSDNIEIEEVQENKNFEQESNQVSASDKSDNIEIEEDI